jgi:hypothetical protein
MRLGLYISNIYSPNQNSALIINKYLNETRSVSCIIHQILFFFFGATAQIWALAYLHETLRFTSVFSES